MALSCTHVPSNIPLQSEVKPQNKIDIHGVARLDCNNCSECPQFISVPGYVLCAYCGCPPARHNKLDLYGFFAASQAANRPQPASDAARAQHHRSCRYWPNGEARHDGHNYLDNYSPSHSAESSDAESTSSGVSSFSGGARNRWRSSSLAGQTPPRAKIVFDRPPAGRELQLENSWSPSDKSENIFLKPEDPLTFHRNPVFQFTDGIRGKRAYTSGLHVWEVFWPLNKRGTHPLIGVATAQSPLVHEGYRRLVGSNQTSWGWCLNSLKLYHDSPKLKNGMGYPRGADADLHLTVPESFYMILDMDQGTLSFQVYDDYLGTGFSDLQGLELYPVASSVWGHCEVTLKYIGSHEEEDESSDKN